MTYTNDIDELMKNYPDEDEETREQIAYEDAESMMERLEEDLISLGDHMFIWTSRCDWQGKPGCALIRSKDFLRQFDDGTIEVDIDEENRTVSGSYSSHDIPTGSSFKGIFIDDFLEELEDAEEWDVYCDIYDLMANKKFKKLVKEYGIDL